MTRRVLIIGIVATLAMAFMAGLGTSTQTASADNGPHVATGADSTPDKCAGCHRIHTGQNEYLLKEGGSIQAFCYSCHGNGGPGSDLAVQEGTFYGETTPGTPYGGKGASTTRGLRAGGFDAARINTTDPNMSLPAPTPVGYAVSIGVLSTTQPVKSKHVPDGTTAGMQWGSGPIGTLGAGISNTLDCTACHDQHGNGQYRILRRIPTGAETTTEFAVPDTYGKSAISYTVGNYFTMNQDANGDGTPDPTPARYAGTATPSTGMSILVDSARWCSQCHTRYLARSGRTVPPASEASRADSGDDIFTFRHTSAGWGLSVPTPAPTGQPQATPSVSFNNRTCITCHASHGSNASMPGTLSSTVEWPDGSTTNPSYDTERASMLKMDNRGICRRCHSTGSVP